jgi:hypothetical protein
LNRLAFCLGILAALAAAPSAAVEHPPQFRSGDPVVDKSKAYLFFRSNIRNGNILLVREKGRAAPAASQPHAVDPRKEPGRWFQVKWNQRFTSSKEGATYLVAVEPGTYAVYGNIMILDDVMGIGVCPCMGSVRFEAKAGEIADLGAVVFPDFGKTERPWTARIAPFDIRQMPPAPSLPGLPVAPAMFRAAGKIPNYFGVEISRQPEIPGVIGYVRDQVIDLRDNKQVPPSE